MISKDDISFFLIGHDSTHNFFLNMDIIRNNHKDGGLYNITGVYNGDIRDIRTGTAENNFITINNRGYQQGAFDLYKKSLEFAQTINTKYTVVMNFDVWFMNGEKFINIIEEFDKTEKTFCTGKDIQFGRPLTDLFIFKTANIPHLEEYVLLDRYNDPRVKEEYSSSKFGWNIFEEWMLYSLYKKNVGSVEKYDENELSKYWHIINRGEHPRYSWSDENKILHTHSNIEKQKRLIENNLDGKFIKKYLDIEFKQ